MITFGEKLRRRREELNLSLQALADICGYTNSAISKWERGAQIPAANALRALCKALGVQCTYFDDCDYAPVKKTRPPGRPRKPRRK